uniref:Uncharacterized protein n=1 Tax=Rhizophora mucronata TaxID=61149 RepID=A0A2P2R100_RHIMU
MNSTSMVVSEEKKKEFTNNMQSRP